MKVMEQLYSRSLDYFSLINYTAALTAYKLLRIVQVRHSSLGIFGKRAFYFRWWMIFNWVAD